MRALLLILFLLLAGSRAALADEECSAPLADWQPPEALTAKLEADGWRDVAIRVHDGCYLVHAGNAQGERLHGLFDPATLTAVQGHRRGHHGDGEGRRRHGEED